MKLISMTSFVLKQAKEPDYENIFYKCLRYANFLKQPLKLEMFVPCDDEGNVWKFPPTEEEWEWASRDSVEAEQSFKQKEYFYKKAKEKVLFEGNFKYERNIVNDFVYFNNTAKLLKDKTIDDLSKYDLTLTESAKKQIGL